MYKELDRLYGQACSLCNFLYYRRQSDPRFTRIYSKARARQERRGDALRDWQEAEIESLAWSEAESDYYGR